MATRVPHQPSLFGGPEPSFDAAFGHLRRVHLDGNAWIDLAAGWVDGAEGLFDEVAWGSVQRTWEHAVLKVARAGPRISIAFRHGLDQRAYGKAPRARDPR